MFIKDVKFQFKWTLPIKCLIEGTVYNYVFTQMQWGNVRNFKKNIQPAILKMKMLHCNSSPKKKKKLWDVKNYQGSKLPMSVSPRLVKKCRTSKLYIFKLVYITSP